MSLPPGSKLGLVAGGGQMPLRVVTAALGKGVDLTPPEVPAAIRRAAKGL